MRTRLVLSQRVVVVIALGFASYVLGLWITNLATHPLTGGVAYAPLQNTSFSLVSVGGMHSWVRVVLWLLLSAVGAFASSWLLRPMSPRRDAASERTP